MDIKLLRNGYLYPIGPQIFTWLTLGLRGLTARQNKPIRLVRKRSVSKRFSNFGLHMDTYLQWTFALFVLAAMAAVGSWAVRTYLPGGVPSAGLFKPKGERRLGVVEIASIDAKRRLVLVRRDDKEHLLLTGGPVDVVVEAGIAADPSRKSGERG